MQLKGKHISIVMLHGVSDDQRLDDLKPWVITHKSFITLLDYFEANSYNTVLFDDLDRNVDLGNKNVIITFDDCPKHLLDFAIPELLKRKMKAVFYMPTAHLGGHNEWNASEGLSRMELMNEDDMRYLVNVGMEVGSHSHNHCMLEELSENESSIELSKSKSLLEKILDKPVLTAAYPYGSLPKSYDSIMKRLNYKYGLSVYSIVQSKYSLRRWIYDDTDTLDTIRHKMSFKYELYRIFADKYNYCSTHIARALYRRYSFMKRTLLNK